MAHSPEYLQRCFRHFAEICTGRSPLYALLSARVADDPAVYALVADTEQGQPVANLLFAGVQYLLLSGARHELAEFYPSVGGQRAPEGAYPAFADFCREHGRTITDLAESRRVQTNEVGRCGLLLPAIALAWERFDCRPLALVDLGASAGLHLLLDQYRYTYSNGHTCGADSPVRIETELRGELAPPRMTDLPAISGRLGIDRAPVDVRDEDACRWTAALIWANQVDRMSRFWAAVGIARRSPPPIIQDDALRGLPQAIGQLEAMSQQSAAALCVYHSHCTYQLKESQREELRRQLMEIGARRDFAYISLEWLGDDDWPQLHLSVYHAGHERRWHLAECDHHGLWMRWLDDDLGTQQSRS